MCLKGGGGSPGGMPSSGTDPNAGLNALAAKNPMVPGGSQDPNNPGLPSLTPPPSTGGFNPLSLLFPIATKQGRNFMFPLLSRLFK